jgi:hypothetical protein
MSFLQRQTDVNIDAHMFMKFATAPQKSCTETDEQHQARIDRPVENNTGPCRRWIAAEETYNNSSFQIKL